MHLTDAVFGRAVLGGSYQVAPMNSTLWLVTSSSPSFSTLTGEFSGTLDTPPWTVIMAQQGMNVGLASFMSLT